MEKSKVYFSDMRVEVGSSILAKLENLLKAAGIESIDFDKQFTAIKIHFGERGNMAFLRPNYARVVVDTVKRLGGKPFLTDCSTLYVGGRKNAPDHLETAYENGYSPFSTGCHIIIADGLKGTDEAYVPFDGDYIKEAKVGQAIMDADIILTINHFKGHEVCGFGGAVKNVGMGCGSRAGKMEMHKSGKPRTSNTRCIGCGKCLKMCAHDAIQVTDKKASINHDKCVGCGRCIGACPTDAIFNNADDANPIVAKKIVEYAAAILKGRPHFHVSFVIDVSPYCDCHSDNDAPIIADIGMFASFDPVALDFACIQAVNKQTPLPGTLLAESHAQGNSHLDHFTAVFPTTDWRATFDHAVKMGLGSIDYELIEV